MRFFEALEIGPVYRNILGTAFTLLMLLLHFWVAFWLIATFPGK